MPSGRTHRLVVLGGERVGKTAIIEQLMYGNHVIGHVRNEYYNDINDLPYNFMICVGWSADCG